MQKITIVRSDHLVGVNGLFLEVDCASLPLNLHAVQWDGEKGEAEWIDSHNTLITTLTPYQTVIDAWQVKKDFIDAKELDPYHGMTPEEKWNAQQIVKKNEIEGTYKATCSAPVLINGVSYKGGESSAAGISNAVVLAQGRGWTKAKIADVNRVVKEITFEEAGAVAEALGIITYDAFLVRAYALVALEKEAYQPA